MAGNYCRYTPSFRAARLRQVREGMSPQEVADQFGLKLVTIINWLRRARRGAELEKQAQVEREAFKREDFHV